MKKILLLIMSLVFSLQCACSSGQNTQAYPPTSLEDLGYTIDLQMIPETMRQDTMLRNEYELRIQWDGSFTSLDMLVYVPLDAEPYTAMLLQAVPANKIELHIGSEIFPIEKWADYIVFQYDDIMVFDVYSLAFDTNDPIPERIQQKYEEEEVNLTEKLNLLLAETVEDSAEFRDIRLGLSVTSETRYLDYLWEYYHENIGRLIQKME